MSIHIGQLIKEKVTEKRLSQEALGKMINTTKQNVGNIYKRRSIDTQLLLKLCTVLEFDFFEALYAEEPLKSMRQKEIDAFTVEISALQTFIVRSCSFSIHLLYGFNPYTLYGSVHKGVYQLFGCDQRSGASNPLAFITVGWSFISPESSIWFKMMPSLNNTSPNMKARRVSAISLKSPSDWMHR